MRNAKCEIMNVPTDVLPHNYAVRRYMLVDMQTDSPFTRLGVIEKEIHN